MRVALVAVVVFVALVPARRAAACATCGCGDPTLTVMGSGTPFAGRLRLSARLQLREDRLGVEGLDRARLREAQLAVGLAYTPDDRVTLSLTVPTVLRDLRWANAARATTLGPGDLELRARVIAFRDRVFAPEHLVGLTGGVKLPTSIDHHRPGGARLPVDAQSGTGSVDPIAGVFYTHLADPVAFFASATVFVPLAGRYEEQAGVSVRTTLALQYRLDDHVTLRGAVDTRTDAPARAGGVDEPGSEHFALFLSPEVLWAPAMDVILSLAVRTPVLEVSGQNRSESPYVVLSMVVDV